MTALRASSPAASMTEGFDVLVHEVIAAIVTAPWSSVYELPFRSGHRSWAWTMFAGA